MLDLTILNIAALYLAAPRWAGLFLSFKSTPLKAAHADLPGISNPNKATSITEGSMNLIIADDSVVKLNREGAFPTGTGHDAIANVAAFGLRVHHRAHIQIDRLIGVFGWHFGVLNSKFLAIGITRKPAVDQNLVIHDLKRRADISLDGAATFLDELRTCHGSGKGVSSKKINLALFGHQGGPAPFLGVIASDARFLFSLAFKGNGLAPEVMPKQRASTPKGYSDLGNIVTHLAMLLNIIPPSCLPIFLSQKRTFQDSGTMSANEKRHFSDS